MVSSHVGWQMLSKCSMLVRTKFALASSAEAWLCIAAVRAAATQAYQTKVAPPALAAVYATNAQYVLPLSIQ